MQKKVMLTKMKSVEKWTGLRKSLKLSPNLRTSHMRLVWRHSTSAFDTAIKFKKKKPFNRGVQLNVLSE